MSDTRGAVDWLGSIAAFILVIVVNVLSNALPINGQSMPEISAKYPSLFTPAGFTFAIWSVIYLGLLAYVIYQALPSQRTNPGLAAISKLFVANCVLNAAWIYLWHYDLLVLSVLCMFAILVTLVLIYRKLAAIEEASLAQRIVVHVPFALYTAWITVASIANISAWQINSGWDDVGLSAVDWTILKLAVAGTIGTIMVVKRGDIAFVLVVAWAAWGIASKQVDTQAVVGAATVLVGLGLLLAAYEAARRMRLNFTGP